MEKFPPLFASLVLRNRRGAREKNLSGFATSNDKQVCDCKTKACHCKNKSINVLTREDNESKKAVQSGTEKLPVINESQAQAKSSKFRYFAKNLLQQVEKKLGTGMCSRLMPELEVGAPALTGSMGVLTPA
ncbi:hypothetical protein Fot_20376 [Forsythia ovata]|uniref:Uncharacterized protein n=1 Tax=Forsythia ovata TaxID=205694 RepID=A0ABD1VRN0_9LAMI